MRGWGTQDYTDTRAAKHVNPTHARFPIFGVNAQTGLL